MVFWHLLLILVSPLRSSAASMHPPFVHNRSTGCRAQPQPIILQDFDDPEELTALGQSPLIELNVAGLNTCFCKQGQQGEHGYKHCLCE